MKKIKLLALMAMMSIGCQAQVTYFETNNFLLNYFTNSGFLAYDWRFEPQKTDVERGNLKGAPTKIVTNITDNTGRGFGVHFTDTTYYNAQGNIAKVVALNPMCISTSIMPRDNSLTGHGFPKPIIWMVTILSNTYMIS